MVDAQALEKFSIKRFDYKLQRYNLCADAICCLTQSRKFKHPSRRYFDYKFEVNIVRSFNSISKRIKSDIKTNCVNGEMIFVHLFLLLIWKLFKVWKSYRNWFSLALANIKLNLESNVIIKKLSSLHWRHGVALRRYHRHFERKLMGCSALRLKAIS